jgi:type IV pilus assembly protein PilE
MELMITVAVMGILVSIAYPSYREHLRRAARADAKVLLMEDAQFLERNFTEAGRYDRDAGGVAVVLPAIQAPKDGAANYLVTLTATQTTYVLSASPAVGGLMDADSCGTLTLNQLGQKGASGSLGVAACWNR